MQESIYLIVDVASALVEGTAEGNTYMIDSRVQDKRRSSHRESPMYIRVTGVHDPSGRSLSDVTLNWAVTSLLSEPDMRPSERHMDARRSSQLSLLLGLARVTGSLQTLGQVLQLLTPRGNPGSATGGSPQPDDVGPTDADEPASTPAGAPEGSEPGDLESLRSLLAGGRLPPVLVDISGPAVADKVMFPALYGSPDFGTDGWYWSASVDTHKVGVHRFTMHLALFRPNVDGRTLSWVPEIHTCNAYLEVCSVQAVNGFTGAQAGWLPLPTLGPAEGPPPQPGSRDDPNPDRPEVL